MENYEKMYAVLDDMKKDLDAFYEKGNASAGTRARVKLQEVKKLAQEVREEIQNIKKGNA